VIQPCDFQQKADWLNDPVGSLEYKITMSHITTLSVWRILNSMRGNNIDVIWGNVVSFIDNSERRNCPSARCASVAANAIGKDIGYIQWNICLVKDLLHVDIFVK
jgi:hypothetical protein